MLVNEHPALNSVAPQPGQQDADAAVSQPDPMGAGWTAVTVVIGAMATLIAVGGMVLQFRAMPAEIQIVAAG